MGKITKKILAEIYERGHGENLRGPPEELLGVIAGGTLQGVQGNNPWCNFEKKNMFEPNQFKEFIKKKWEEIL